MPKINNKKTREEKLAQARLHRRQKYEELKKDPEKYEAEKEKEKLRYLKRKEQNKLKNIKDLTPRAQRQQRKKWRESHKRYLEKKKKERNIAQMLLDNSPPSSDVETPYETGLDPLERPSAPVLEATKQYQNNNKKATSDNCHNCINKNRQIRKLRYMYNKKIGNLKKDIEKLQKEKVAVQKSLNRLMIKERKSTAENLSTDEKVQNLIENIDESKKEEVKKKLLFGEVIKKQINAGYKALPKNYKRKFSDMFEKESFKKHKILNKISSFTVKSKKVKEKDEQDIKQEIEIFFEDDSNSRIAADKKEFRKAAGVVKQKRYLTDTLINLHEKFLKTRDCKAGYSTFCKNRPFWVVFPKESNRNTCLCILHVNMDLLIKSLNKNKIIIETNGSCLLESLCCDTRREECLNRTCVACNTKVLKYGEFRNDKFIKYYQWGARIDKYTVNGVDKASRKTTKTELQDFPLNLIKKLEESLPRYFRHCLNIVQQYKNISELKKSLTPREVLIHMDFSENYITKFHEEVQARHFGSSPEQITLHTSVAYFLDPDTGTNKTYSMCTVSDCNRHDAEAIWAHIIPILECVKDITHMDTLHFLTDSPSSQYRNCKIFFVISQLQQLFPDLNTVTWNYLESGHSKGAPDGIGAVIKRTADSCVRFGKDIGTLEDFWQIIKAKIKNIEMRIVTKRDIEDKSIPPNIKKFKGTMSVHQVLWSSNSLRMTFRKLSCFLCENGMECAHGYHLGYMDIPDINVEPKQELLQDFLETNTTPELIDELTNSPVKFETTSQDSLKSFEINTQPKEQVFTKSPKVKILSDIRFHWTNTRFYNDNVSTSKASYLQDFEKFDNLPTKIEINAGRNKKAIRMKYEDDTKDNEEDDNIQDRMTKKKVRSKKNNTLFFGKEKNNVTREKNEKDETKDKENDNIGRNKKAESTRHTNFFFGKEKNDDTGEKNEKDDTKYIELEGDDDDDLKIF